MGPQPDTLVELIRERSRQLDPEPTGEAPLLAPLPGIRAVLFDVYGTLIVSGVGDISLAGPGARDEALAAVLAEVSEAHSPGVPLPDPKGLGDQFIAILRAEQDERRLDGVDFPEVDIRRVWRRFLVATGLLDETSAFAEAGLIERAALAYELAVNPVWPMPGIAETLSRLRSAGLALGIVSNAQFFTPLLFRAFLKAPLAALGFDERICAWSYTYLEAKPSTFLYDTAAAALERYHGISPEQVLFVGNDRRNDVYPANEVGFRTALFAGDRRSLRWRNKDPIAGGVRPDRIVTELIQIPGVLEPS